MLVMVINIFKVVTRKIQKVRYSYLVSLPVEWIKHKGIGKSDSLNIEMQTDDSLKIFPAPVTRQDEKGAESSTPANKKEVLACR
ncbi:hypothetical protein [Methanosarcina sp. UBA289]|uniref:hypothetical protein n=1 Tax=Methanosarcina sp. UBA289 TaxID=1915574 RepID=UPI0025DA20CB|nr:hypothetical protein [Methanosarcina sp. UBA289]